MPEGIQCWDAAGNICVDITDFQLRFVKSDVISLPFGQVTATQVISGVSPATHVAFITGGPSYGEPVHIRVVAGGVRIYTWQQYGISAGEAYSFDLYRWG